MEYTNSLNINKYNIVVLNLYPFVCQQSGLLGNELGSYKKPRHPVHLGKQGISLLGSIFKDSILGRKIDGRGYSNVVAHRAYAHDFPALAR